MFDLSNAADYTPRIAGRLRRVILPAVVVALLAVAMIPSLSLAEEGWATWYGEPFHGRVMYGGQIYDMHDPTTTACNIYPIGTWIRVTNPVNGKSVIVQVRDRGAFKHALDLSYAAFAALDNPAKMMIRVQYEVLPGPSAAPSIATSTPEPKASLPEPTPAPAPTPSKPPVEYTVGPGDTVVSIAARFGLDSYDLITWNDLSNPDLLITGQRLTLRAPIETPTTTARGGQATAQVRSSGATYVVDEGDTLWGIAVRFDTTPDELLALNDLGDGDIIIIGQVLRLPGSPSAMASSGVSGGGEYVVQEGDTLLDIALNLGTTVEALLEANGIDDADLIQIGQVLSIPQ